MNIFDGFTVVFKNTLRLLEGMIELRIPLFGLACHELPIAGAEIEEPDVFASKGDELQNRMYHVRDIVHKLIGHGWTVVGELFRLVAYHDDIDTVMDAVSVLQRLHVDLDGLTIMEADENPFVTE
mgnify:CR=1 FL=1